jgi:ABC-type Na+ efflux pump permease subunit
VAFLFTHNKPIMKKILLLAGLFLSLSALAQNGGHGNETESLKITFGGFVDNKYVINLHNLQDCDVEVKVTYSGTVVTKLVAANSIDTVQLASTGQRTIVQARPTTNCRAANLGTVELSVDVLVLPIKFTNFYIRKKAKA